MHDLSFMFVTHSSCHTSFGVYPVNKMAGSAPRQCHVNHAVHDMHVMICTIGPVSYVCHTLLSHHTNFGIYQFNETAAKAPRSWRVTHAVHDMHDLSFMFFIQSCYIIPILTYIPLTKRPEDHKVVGG